MAGGHPVVKYQFAARVRDGLVSWTMGIQTDDGVEHVVELREAEEVPLLREICRSDATIYYDGETQTLRTGWNVPGKMGKL